MSTSGDCVYDNTVTTRLKIIYATSIAVWILIVWSMGVLKKKTISSMFILLFPIIVLAIAAINVSHVSKEVEQINENTSNINWGVLVALPLITWVKGQKEGVERDSNEISIVLFVMLVMITPVDVWVSKRSQSYVIHIKSILQLYTLGILLHLLLSYFSTK